MDYIVKAYKDWKLHSQFQEIVPDMDDEFMFNEKQSIRDSARTLKKYGSTCCNNMRNNDPLIRHDVEKTDTLQGIALKYGCTTEQIRRVNRLYASDSLFLRQFLLVPVEKTSPYYAQALNGTAASAALVDVLTTPPTTPDVNMQRDAMMVVSANNANHSTLNPTNSNSSMSSSSNSCTSSNSTTNNTAPTTHNTSRPGPLHTRPYSIAGELLVQGNEDDPAMMYNHHNPCSSKQSKSLDSVAAMTPEEENRKCINDFLNKIDNTISESRKYVERSKDMIASQANVNICITTDVVSHRRNNQLNNSYKNNNNRPPQHHQRHSSTGSGSSDTAQLLNTTQTRRVQNSLKKLEKQQDDFFEL